MKKWIAGLLTLVMLSHALPWTAFADAVAAGKLITENELTRALQIAGLQPVSRGTLASEEGDLSYRLEAKQNEYHDGMTPNETWDAGMLRAWLNDKLSKDLYHVTDVFTRADSRLQQMKSDDPAAYTRLTANAEYSGFAEECHNAMLNAVDIEEKHRFLNHSIMQDVTLIENNAERLADLEDRLYDSEKARISAQIREATNHLADLRSQVMALQEQEMKEVRQLQGVILGDSKPAFSDWLHEVLSSGEDVQRSTVSANTIQVVDAYTRMSRMTSGRRVLSNDDSQDTTVKVIKKDQFAFEMQGVDNQPVSGVNVTVKDLNGKTVETKTTDELGSVVFDSCNYVNDFDFTMELSLDVKASGVGYRDFYIPWTIISQGQVLHETLVLLTGPETRENKANGTREEKEARAIAIAKEGEVKPYISTCMFNGLDIMKRDLTIWISPLNDADLDFTIEVTHEKNKEGDPPWLHFQYYDIKTDRSGWTEMQPSRREVVNAQKTRYVYTRKWKQYLRPDILEEDRPYFVIPSTKEKVQTKLAPVRSLVDQPITTGQEASNPFTTVFSKAFGFNFALPEGMGILGLSLPFEKNLPKINCLPNGYVTVAWGSSIVNPEEPVWQTDESNKYDKAMKNYAHEKSLAKKKQAMGTAYDYYHGLRDIKCQSRLDFDLGFFVMGTGRCQKMEDGTSLWGFSAMFGTTMTLNFDTTFMVTIAYIPLYLNINIGGCFGIGIDLFHVTWNTDKNGRPINARFEPFNNLTINLRLSAGFTVGVGIKGIVSVWFGGSFILNLIVSVNVSAPDRAQVYIEGSLSVGFELFWIKYSKVVFDIGRRKVHDDTFNAQPSNDQPQYTLFDAYAEANDEPEQAEILSHEPEHYPALVPEAWLATVMDPGQNVKIVRYKDYDFCFGSFWFQDGPAKNGKLRIRNLTTGYALTTDSYLWDFFRENKLYLSNYSVYGHDAYSDGDRLHVVLTLAKSFDDQSKPIPGGDKDKPNIVVVYMEFEGIDPDRASGNMPILKRALMYRWIVDVNNAITPACSNPRIAGVRKMGGQPVVIGSLDGQTEDGNSSQFNTFCIEPERADDPNSPIFAVYGDMTVAHIESDHTRVAMFPSIRIWGEGSQRKEAYSISQWHWALPSMGFIAVERSKSGQQFLTYFDYSQNWFLGEVQWKDSHLDELIAPEQRDPLFVEMGTYNDIEVVQSIGGNVDPTMSLFYTHRVTTKEGREGYQLIGIYMSPRTFTNKTCHDADYDMVYSDFDVLLPVPDFDTATIGVSQYLYWLTTAPREKDTDPYVWRIDGMYYDRDTNSLSDELAIAEFTLPKISYGDRSYNAVPQQITLTDTGVGYITAAPDLGEEQHDALPLTLYSFPITLKPHMTMQKAALMETTVVQGDFVHTDFSMMNDGNMGIANFEVEVRHLKRGWDDRECIETLYGDLLVPDNSKLVMHGDRDEVVATGEHALYRSKDFIYSPKRHDWLVRTEEHNVHISGSIQKDSIGDGASDHVVTNVLVPGVLGGFAGAIKIPNDWTGKHDLRLKLTKYSTYSNWLAASRLAQTNPELFTDLESNSATAQSNREKLAARGIVRLDYALDEASGKMLLQNAAEVLANGGDVPVNLFAQEVTASNDIDIDCEVHDLQVDYRLWNDYYGDEMLDIVLHDYYQDNGTMELTCAMYLDNSATPVYVSLPYDSEALSADMTTTISLPLSTLFDPSAHRSARFVFTPRGVAETADVNNEFTIYTGGSPSSDLHFTKQSRKTVTVQEGGDVSFEVEVAGGVKPYSYQWQVWDEKDQEWKDIRNSNSPTLSRKNIEKKWDGCMYQCIVTDAEGNRIISQVFTLYIRDIVPTGDHSNLPLYLAIAFVALALLALLRRRTKNN